MSNCNISNHTFRFALVLILALCFFIPAQPHSAEALETITIPLPNMPADAKPLEMVLIPAGTFMMGSPEDEKDRNIDHGGGPEGPQHQVTITKPFFIGKYQVTNAQWNTIAGDLVPGDIASNYPKSNVSWNDIQVFISRLNSIIDQGIFTLPTEAEWEYAYRAGTTTRFYWGDDLDYSQIDDYAWYRYNSDGATHEVGLKIPNPWGLFDMTGNLYDMCFDYYTDHYPSESVVDPLGPSTGGDGHVLRGSHFTSYPQGCRAAYRYYSRSLDKHDNNTGFRLKRLYFQGEEFPTPKPTNTPIPKPTNTPLPTNTLIPLPTNTPTPIPQIPNSTGTEPFEFPIEIDIGPSTFNLLLGTRIQASDFYDPGIDILSPPADPSGREAYFILDDGQKLWTDLRQVDTPNRKWMLIITVPPNQEAEIKWNSSLIPDDGYLVPVDARGRPAGKSIDMKEQATIDIPALGGFVARKFYYSLNFETVLPVTVQYDLITGWNLISVPVKVEDDVTPDKVFGPLTPIWSYNPEISQYEKPASLETHKGFWVYVDRNRTFEITGRPENNLPITLIPTWSLIGVNQSVLRSTEGIGVVWGYDNVTKRYLAVAPTEYLEPQNGYWFQVSEPVELFGTQQSAKVSTRRNISLPLSVDKPGYLYVLNPTIENAPLAVLEFGRDPDASDTFGPEDYLAPPPVPDSAGNAFFLVNTGVDYVKAMRDIRSMSGAQEWILEIDQNPGIPASLSWDSHLFTDLPVAEMIEIDPNTLLPVIGISPIQINIESMLQLEAPSGFAGTNRFFKITLSEETSVNEWFILK